MKNFFLLIFLTISVLAAQGQKKAPTDTSIAEAQQAIKQGKAKFLLLGGIAATYFKGQEVFEKKYNIKYYEFGCVMPDHLSIDRYNKIIANYLDKKYGLGWRKEVRKDVKGI